MPDMTDTKDTIGYKTYETAMGLVTVYTVDEPGAKGHKAGTTKMEYTGQPPRPITLRKKYRQAQVALTERGKQ